MGYEVDINLVEAGFIAAMRSGRTDVRSNMVNGMPSRKEVSKDASHARRKAQNRSMMQPGWSTEDGLKRRNDLSCAIQLRSHRLPENLIIRVTVCHQDEGDIRGSRRSGKKKEEGRKNKTNKKIN